MVLTGLRGVGKTVLLDSFRPLAIELGWIWVRHRSLGVHQCQRRQRGHPAVHGPVAHYVRSGDGNRERCVEPGIRSRYSGSTAHSWLPSPHGHVPPHPRPGAGQDQGSSGGCLGCLVADTACHGESSSPTTRRRTCRINPPRSSTRCRCCSTAFSHCRKRGFRLMLVLTGLPTLFPKLVEARTFSERMFRVLFPAELGKVRKRGRDSSTHSGFRLPAAARR